MNRTMAHATGVPAPSGPTPRERAAPHERPAFRDRAARPAPGVLDLRGRPARCPDTLRFGPRDIVVVTGLPGSGKSTLMRRAVTARRLDSQDTRARFAARLPRPLPYALYRPLARAAHYWALRRALRAEQGLVVHDCGTQPWVRRWLARAARRSGATLHLLLLDVPAEAARAGQYRRGRTVSRRAFERHRRTTARLLGALRRGEMPAGCGSAVLLDRAAADAVQRIVFTEYGSVTGTR
ncbi:AAA family ATPase [Streptomyces sp. AM6-12]|uniref:AAA family ATPase n=1 Tax=Streptomyces sp. AM6-12 TaxID=3345149 RepID=UPI0037AB6430